MVKELRVKMKICAHDVLMLKCIVYVFLGDIMVSLLKIVSTESSVLQLQFLRGRCYH